MSKSGKGFNENGNAINPRHFIYLDRNRLLSYISQTSDGLPTVRNLLESISDQSTDSPDEETRELEIEEKIGGEAEGNILAAKVSAKRDKTKTTKTTIKGSNSPTNRYESLNMIMESKIEHDNLYLALEKDLKDSKRLGTISDFSNPQSPSSLSLIKVKGNSRFFDWNSLLNLFDDPDPIWEYIQDSFDNQKNLKDISRIMRQFSIGEITFSLQIKNRDKVIDVLASLDPKNLYLTIEQLRGCYMIHGSVELTLVGFVAKKTNEEPMFPGLVGQMNFSESLKAFVGDVDILVEPLAIYG